LSVRFRIKNRIKKREFASQKTTQSE
jgi:hypothetical protein